MKKWLGLIPALAFTACATVTVSPDGEPKRTDAPTMTETKQFFFWGLTPEVVEVDVAAICGGASNVSQMQAQNTLIDGVLGAVTLGIYAPRTVNVWCK